MATNVLSVVKLPMFEKVSYVVFLITMILYAFYVTINESFGI